MFHDVVPIGNSRCETEVLLDEKDREPLLLEAGDGSAYLLDDDRCQSFGRFVQHEKVRAGAQDAADGEHLLFTTRQFCTLTGGPFGEVRKQIEDLLHRQSAGADLGRQHQVFHHVEAGENTTFFGTDCQAKSRDLIRRKRDGLAAVETCRTGPLGDHAHQGFERRRLAGAIAPEQCDDFTPGNRKIDTMQDMALAIPGLQTLDLKQLAIMRHGRLRGRPAARPCWRTPSHSHLPRGSGRVSGR